MRDIQQLLREKKNALEQVRLEVDALRSASLLLSDKGTSQCAVRGSWNRRL